VDFGGGLVKNIKLFIILNKKLNIFYLSFLKYLIIGLLYKIKLINTVRYIYTAKLPNENLKLFETLYKAKKLDNLGSVLQLIKINGFINLFSNTSKFSFFFRKNFWQ